MCEKQYNGYTNYETWVVNLWIDNDEYTQDETRDWMTENHNTFQYKFQLDEAYREFVEELFDSPTSGLAGDLIGHALDNVNWKELTDLLIEELELDQEEEEEEEQDTE
jgi:hypothetical protein